MEGLVAANVFQATSSDDAAISSFSEASPIDRRVRGGVAGKPEIMLDLEDRDWNYKVESGMPNLQTSIKSHTHVFRCFAANHHESRRKRTKIYQQWTHYNLNANR